MAQLPEGEVSAASTLYKIDSSGALTTLHHFIPTVLGCAAPLALVQASDGFFYGPTIVNTIVRLDSAGNPTTIKSFVIDRVAAEPSKLIQANDGNSTGLSERLARRLVAFLSCSTASRPQATSHLSSSSPMPFRQHETE